MWTDPIVVRGLIGFAVALAIVFALCWFVERTIARLDRRVPRYRRPLIAAYASFHGFLLAVRLATRRRLE